MREYHNLLTSVLESGVYKPNRTAVDTVSSFSQQMRIDVGPEGSGFPLLTTKSLAGSRWNSLVHEFIWYLSGEEHIRTLREETSIWDQWSNDEGELETAYGRFWRRYPVPADTDKLPGEAWVTEDDPWATREPEGNLVVDQLDYIRTQLETNPSTRRLVCSAWHPGNATTSLLPPCHFTFVFSVQGDTLNLHLTQRSGDVAVGIPFNIASYALLLRVMAKETGFTPGVFSHEIVDAHLYCGDGERGKWYDSNLETVSELVRDEEYAEAQVFIEENAPDPNHSNSDHIPGVLTQLQRDYRKQPVVSVSDDVSIDTLTAEDISLRDYNPAGSLRFFVAE